jgi:hypothetical protein
LVPETDPRPELTVTCEESTGGDTDRVVSKTNLNEEFSIRGDTDRLVS